MVYEREGVTVMQFFTHWTDKKIKFDYRFSTKLWGNSYCLSTFSYYSWESKFVIASTEGNSDCIFLIKSAHNLLSKISTCRHLF